MNWKKTAIFLSLLICTTLVITGCGNNEPVDGSPEISKGESNESIKTNNGQIEGLNGKEKDSELIKEDIEPSFENNTPRVSAYEIKDSEVAEFYSYNFQGKWMYIAGLKVFDEFGTKNEGGASIDTEENTLTFSITKATGSVTGTLDGPQVYFKMDLITNEIIEKEFNPAPNYAELGITEFSHNSEKVIELSNERLIEIGVYFKNLIEEIEKKNS